MRFLRKVAYPMLVAVTVALFAGPSRGGADPAPRCDELAASPFDDDAPNAGVPIQRIRYDEAISACIDAVRSAPGEPRYLFELGRAVYGSGDDHRGARIVAEAAIRGYPAAMMYLGSIFVSGQGMRRDLNIGFQWHRAAAEKGNLAAQSVVGLAYWLGRGVSADVRQAERWLTLAARRGDVPAQVNLAEIHAGQNNLASAARWYAAAASRGDADAQYRLGTFHEH